MKKITGKGWKTWVGSAAMVAIGGYLIYSGNPEAGMGFVSAGLAAIGLGHKAEKIKALLEK